MEIDMNKDLVIETLSEIFDHELKGVIRYTHYALMIFGPNMAHFLWHPV